MVTQNMFFSDFEKIKTLNEYFSSISNVDDDGVNLPNSYLLCDDTLSDIVIQEQEIFDIISIKQLDQTASVIRC